MSQSLPDLEIRYANPTAFANQVKSLNPKHRAVLIMALEHILGRYGLNLAKSSWLRYLGSSLWEFRVGPSSKAIESKPEAPFDDVVPFTKVLIRIFCSFQNNQIVILGCYDKSRFGSGKRQHEAIQKARESLLTFKLGE